MAHWIVWFMSFFTSDADIDAFRRSAPTYLTPETAEHHLVAARVAAEAHKVDETLLLSIAHHESRYSHKEVTPEPTVGAGAVSCGVMTPEPTWDRKKCADATSSILNGYLAGAAHLRGWIDGPTSYCRGNMRCALLGYAGGFALIQACAKGSHVVEREAFQYVNGKVEKVKYKIDLCGIVWEFQSRAAYIKKLMNPPPLKANT